MIKKVTDLTWSEFFEDVLVSSILSIVLSGFSQVCAWRGDIIGQVISFTFSTIFLGTAIGHLVFSSENVIKSQGDIGMWIFEFLFVLFAVAAWTANLYFTVT